MQSEEPAATEGFPHLQRPPITEVICGLVFPAVSGLDAFEFGVYWNERRDEYPEHRLQPAIVEGLSLSLDGVQPMRAWLVSPNDGELLQQIQADRFYMNWRKRGSAYPHFSDPKDGQTKGLKSITLAEFERLVEFCGRRPTIARRPEPSRVEIAKIDILKRGQEWVDLADLAVLLPVTEPFTKIGTTERIEISIRVQEALDDGWLSVRINSSSDARGNVTSIRLETRASVAVEKSTAAEALSRGNTRLNEKFFRLIPDARSRFGRED